MRDTTGAVQFLDRLATRVRRIAPALANVGRTVRPPPPRRVEITHTVVVDSEAGEALTNQVVGPEDVGVDLRLSGSPPSIQVTSTATGRSVRVVEWGDEPTTDVIAPVEPRLGRPIRWTQPGRGRVVVPPGVTPDGWALRFLVARCRRADRVLADAALTESPSSARVVATIAATGAPLELEGAVPAGSLLGPQTTAIAMTPAGGSDRDRELRSVRLRRAARREHGPAAWVREIGGRLGVELARSRTISILLASNRPDDLPHALDQIAAQRDCDVQVVLGLHGSRWPSSTADVLAERFEGDLLISHHDDSSSLGEVLEALAGQADGELLTKWDDDDWYGPDHLGDLVSAYDYANADIVGKFAEFVYLEASDATIRRRPRGAETYDWKLAGGTLLLSAEWLAEIGGWPAAPRSVDQLLLDATRRKGGRAYRTHGFQYVLRRRADGHTWAAPDAYFDADASGRRPGLDLAFADIEAQP